MSNETLGAAAPSRKARFGAAIALAETTVKAWAAEQNVTPQHLYHVLSGERESASLTEKVDAFIAEWLPSTDAA